MKKIARIFGILILLFLVIYLTLFLYAYFKNRQMLRKAETRSHTFRPIEGWYEGQKINYYDFGSASSKIGKQYVLVSGFKDNEPIKLLGQKDILDSKKGDFNYTDFRRIYYVTVPKDYKADSIKNEAVLLSKKWPKKEGAIINHPQVFKNDSVEPSRPKEENWADNKLVYSYTFETDLKKDPKKKDQLLLDALVVPTFMKDKKPERVDGQLVIFASASDSAFYSPLHEVFVVEAPKDYQANALNSVPDIIEKKLPVSKTRILLNCPYSK
jgi:hypothetical protein